MYPPSSLLGPFLGPSDINHLGDCWAGLVEMLGVLIFSGPTRCNLCLHFSEAVNDHIYTYLLPFLDAVDFVLLVDISEGVCV